MNGSITDHNGKGRMSVVAAILGAFLMMALLVWIMRHYTTPAPLDANRAAERARVLAELRATEAQALGQPGWIDPAKGIVRLPIETAMRIVERDWQNPAAGRSNLLARVEKAAAVVPAAPAQPSQFE
jgi:hypothetical protein